MQFTIVTNLANIPFLESHAKRRALKVIEALAEFYNVIVWSDNESESEATEVAIQDWSVDDYMDALLDEWGMDWQKVLKLGMNHMQAQPQQAGGRGYEQWRREEED